MVCSYFPHEHAIFGFGLMHQCAIEVVKEFGGLCMYRIMGEGKERSYDGKKRRKMRELPPIIEQRPWQSYWR